MVGPAPVALEAIMDKDKDQKTTDTTDTTDTTTTTQSVSNVCMEPCLRKTCSGRCNRSPGKCQRGYHVCNTCSAQY
jgi:hypothetical protein